MKIVRFALTGILVVVLLVSGSTVGSSAAPTSGTAATAAVQQASAARPSARLTPREKKLARKKSCTKRQAKRKPVRCKRIAAAKAKRAALAGRPRPGVPPSGEAFTLAVVPDTQNEVFGSDRRLRQRSEWLVANRGRLNLRFVDHIGDLTNWGWLAPQQLAVASDGLQPLEAAGIPYSVSVGNHDTGAVGWNGAGGYGGDAYVKNPECQPRLGAACSTPRLVRRTQEINAVFPAQRFGAVRGAFEPGKIDNVWSTFAGGGREWLVLSLELWPRREAVEWARGVVAAHPGHNVIISTHSYLDGDGAGIYGGSDYGSTSPHFVWDRLASQFPNVVMVLSGHTGTGAVRVDTGRHGNKVVSLLQSFHSVDGNPVRLVRINPGGSLDTWVVSPNGRGGDFGRFARSVGGLSLR